jgi:hypothetical protein
VTMTGREREREERAVKIGVWYMEAIQWKEEAPVIKLPEFCVYSARTFLPHATRAKSWSVVVVGGERVGEESSDRQKAG